MCRNKQQLGARIPMGNLQKGQDVTITMPGAPDIATTQCRMRLVTTMPGAPGIAMSAMPEAPGDATMDRRPEMWGIASTLHLLLSNRHAESDQNALFEPQGTNIQERGARIGMALLYGLNHTLRYRLCVKLMKSENIFLNVSPK